MPVDQFPPGVAERIGHYVYRLVDPRNGETFYVGKGQGDRVFQHAKAQVKNGTNGPTEDLKLARIHAIQAAGLDVQHIVHRHWIPSEAVAFEVEAAVMDCFPAAAQKVGGHGTDRGVRHAVEIIARYGATPFVACHPILLLEIGKALGKGFSPYDATRGCWRVSLNRVKGRLVLGHAGGVVRTAYWPKRWISAEGDTVPTVLGPPQPGKWFFEGSEAEPDAVALYVGHSLPPEYRPKPGAQGGIRYVDPTG